MKVVVAAGGTGGHIYPALAIIRKLQEKEKKLDILYIGTTDRMEKDIVPNMNIPYVGLEMSGMNRKKILSNFSVIKKFFVAYREAKKVLKEFCPDIVIGVGGYITAPVILAAHQLHIKTLIHEQNSIPGFTNKLLSKKADTICISLPNSKRYFKHKNVVYTGNPRSEEIVSIEPLSKKKIGFSEQKLVVIVMGSLGSMTMNQKIQELIPGFLKKNYQVLIITGKNYYDTYQKLEIPSNVKVVPYMDQFIHLLKDTDLIVSRAGASTIAEITSIGLPAILVPSPYVTHNHQYLNAKDLEDVGACQILEEKDFDKDHLIPMIDHLFDHMDQYQAMKEASYQLGVRDSATLIYNEIKKLVGDKNEEKNKKDYRNH